MKISIIHTRALCYYSSSFFLDRIEAALESCGEEVLRTDLPELSQREDAKLLKDISLGDVIIDINSHLPRIVGDSGELWLNEKNIPLYNFILDHPLYHHESLKAPVNNHHLIVLDKSHRDYIKTHYPHIKDVNIMPVCGTPPLSPLPYEEREDGIIFMGTFLPREIIHGEVLALKETYGSEYEKLLLDFMDYWDPLSETMEEALIGYLKEEGISTEELPFETDFPGLMNLLFPADRIKRNIFREGVCVRLSREIPLSVMGEGWEKSRLVNEHVRLLSSEFYPNALQLNGKYKYVLDINPFFTGGIHDRAGNAFAGGSLLFSNMKREENKGPRPGKEYIYYDGEDLSPIVDAINYGVDKKELIAARGMSYWMDNLIWDLFARKLLNIAHNSRYDRIDGNVN